MTADQPPVWMSRQEAAQYLEVDLATVDRMIAFGLLDRYRLAGLYVRLKGCQVRNLAALPVDWLRRC